MTEPFPAQGRDEPQERPETMTRPTRDHRQLHQLIAGLTDGIVLIDLDETILWANQAAIDMHGVGRLADLGRDQNVILLAKELTSRASLDEVFCI